MLKKGLLFCAMSYLIARLAMVLEISRLAMLRFRPRARIVHVTKQERFLDQGIWTFSNTRDHFLYYSETSDAPMIRALPDKGLN